MPLYGHLDGTSGRRWSKSGPLKRASPKRRSSRHPPTPESSPVSPKERFALAAQRLVAGDERVRDGAEAVRPRDERSVFAAQIARCEVVWAQVGVEPESVRGKDRLDVAYGDPAARLVADTRSEPHPLASAVVALRGGEHIHAYFAGFDYVWARSLMPTKATTNRALIEKQCSRLAGASAKAPDGMVPMVVRVI